MEVIAGTYSHLIFGYEVKPNEEGKLKFSTSFTNDSHAGVVKCLTVNRRGFLASGSADESIRLFSLKGRRCEIGSLCQHNGSIVSLKFFKNSYLFSASEDGTIAIWKVNSWDCLKVLKHKEALTDFAIHPSGKLLLSLTKGRTLQTWNLLSGRRAFVTNLKQVGEMIWFSNDGNRFVIVMGNNIDIYTTADALIAHSYNHTSRISSTVFLNNEILLVGDEGGVVNFLDVTACKLTHQLKTNTVRVKAMQCIQQSSSSSLSSSTLFISSSDGYVKLYDVTIENKIVTTSFVTGVVTPHRWLCMAVYDANGKEEEEEDEEDEICAESFKKSKQSGKSPKKKATTSTVKSDDEEGNDEDGENDDEDEDVDDDDDDGSELEEDDGEDLGTGDNGDDDDACGSDKKLSSGKRKQSFPDKQLKKKQKFAGKNDDESGDVRLKKSNKIVKKKSSKENGSKNDSAKREDYVTFSDDDDDTKKPKNKKFQSKYKFKSHKKAFNGKEKYVSFTDDDDNTKKSKNKKFQSKIKYENHKKGSSRKGKHVSFADDDSDYRKNNKKFRPQYKKNKSKNNNSPKKTANNRFNSKRRFNKRTKK
ncbi:hypothetical protein HELRODRAFT_190875 [Helobdella robusta]|uniref:Uncharacterized protein n=1 Tax=Helobdella robusta TaxID=6412 RepID=T1FSD7_HELRO|nr:hypothetical protein HELRODRAFT_190875 [Helobdella robusta]ESO08080.1 hypothetical protein HELRODRAFT_190875 [Helobdella robusta]